MESNALNELAKSGPWALVAGILLYTVIQAWNKDRNQVTTLLGEFRVSFIEFKASIEANTKMTEKLVAKLDKEELVGRR